MKAGTIVDSQDIKPYSQEWKEICDKYEFVILYKDKTNILITIDKG